MPHHLLAGISGQRDGAVVHLDHLPGLHHRDHHPIGVQLEQAPEPLLRLAGFLLDLLAAADFAGDRQERGHQQNAEPEQHGESHGSERRLDRRLDRGRRQDARDQPSGPGNRRPEQVGIRRPGEPGLRGRFAGGNRREQAGQGVAQLDIREIPKHPALGPRGIACGVAVGQQHPAIPADDQEASAGLERRLGAVVHQLLPAQVLPHRSSPASGPGVRRNHAHEPGVGLHAVKRIGPAGYPLRVDRGSGQPHPLGVVVVLVGRKLPEEVRLIRHEHHLAALVGTDPGIRQRGIEGAGAELLGDPLGADQERLERGIERCGRGKEDSGLS